MATDHIFIKFNQKDLRDQEEKQRRKDRRDAIIFGLILLGMSAIILITTLHSVKVL